MMSTMRAVALLMMAVFLIAANGKAEFYRNEEFGIEIPVPKGALLCPHSEEEHDHGPLFLVGTSDPKLCGIDNEHVRHIGIFAGYNAADETKHLNDFLKSLCTFIAKGPCGAAPNGLEIAGFPSASARADLSDGWIEIILVTQAGTPNPDFDPSVPTINYSFGLHTKVKHLEEDLSVFRTILKTVRLTPKREREK